MAGFSYPFTIRNISSSFPNKKYVFFVCREIVFRRYFYVTRYTIYV